VRAHHVLITTLLNPKALLIALVLIPLPGPAEARYWFVLTPLIPLIGSTWIAFGRFLSRSGSQGLTALIPKAASVVLGAFAAILILSALREP